MVVDSQCGSLNESSPTQVHIFECKAIRMSTTCEGLGRVALVSRHGLAGGSNVTGSS